MNDELYFKNVYKGFILKVYKIYGSYSDENLFYCVFGETDGVEYITDRLDLQAALNKAFNVIDTLLWLKQNRVK